MLRLLYLAAALVFLFPAPAGTAPSTTSPAELNKVASKIAGKQVYTRCYKPGEMIDTLSVDPFEYYGAWGYVNDSNRTILHLAAEVCAGALAILADDVTVPNWEKSLGARVLAHEALHAKEWKPPDRWENEAWVECYALKSTRWVSKQLGASELEADDMLAYALAEHWRVVDFAPEYHLKTCRMPYFFPDEGPR